MPIAHDQPSYDPAEASETGVAAAIPCFDPLSDVLRTVKLKGALFFVIDATSPWCVEVPNAADYAEIVLPSARHVVSYHVVLEGQGLVTTPGTEPIIFRAGDVIVLPHVGPYLMFSEPGVPPGLDRGQTLQFFRDMAAGKLPFVIPEGGGQQPMAKFLCGFLGCDLTPFNPLFASLPPILHVRRPNGRHGDLLEQLIELALVELQTPRIGGESIRLGLSELMFIELLRRHLETLSLDGSGWLQGLRDPKVGRAIVLLHAEPAKAWTLDSLARSAGVSRSVLAERFSHCVGETPMHYLTLWRMQIAARLLADGKEKVASIAEQVGFRSEAGFSRTFKKVTGDSPSQWRRMTQLPSERHKIHRRRRG